MFDSQMGAKRLIAFAAALLALIVTATGLAARPHTAASIVLGKTVNYPSSGCPETKGCEVVARVTGIQMVADGADHPFRVPSNGQLVSWWLKLPQLRDTQLRSFSELFGGNPAAREPVSVPTLPFLTCGVNGQSIVHAGGPVRVAAGGQLKVHA